MTAAKLTLSAHLYELGKLIKQAEEYEKMVDKKRFLTDRMAQDAICRVLQMMIEAGLTIGEMIIAQNNFRKPEKNVDIFDILGEKKIITRALIEDFWGVAGFRNILAHNYATLNLNLVYGNLEKCIPAFKKYAQQIAKYLKKKN